MSALPQNLTRQFTLASLAAFALFAALIYQVERLRSEGLREIERENRAAIAALQTELLQQTRATTQRDMVAFHEQYNQNLARLMGNLLWADLLSGYVAQAQMIGTEGCVGYQPDMDELADEVRQICFRQRGQRLSGLPAFTQVDDYLRQFLKPAGIRKVKLFDMRGVTVYSTEARDIGEDRSHSDGWRRAAKEGLPQSKLVRRNEYNPLHARTEHRDLISSYLPLRVPGQGAPVAVIEFYGDVTDFLVRMEDSANGIDANAQLRERAMSERLNGVQARLEQDGAEITGMLLLLTLVLYVSLLFISRRTHRLFAHETARAHASRALLLQTEKMATLGQMIAGVAHQLNTPLAFCRSNLQMAGAVFDRWVLRRAQDKAITMPMPLGDGDDGDADGMAVQALLVPDEELDEARQMLDDSLDGVRMMAELVEQLRGFTRLDQSGDGPVDLNAAISSVAYIARAVISPKVVIKERYGSLPRVRVNASQINQAVLNLLMNAAQSIEDQGVVTLQTGFEGRAVHIAVTDTGCGIPRALQQRVFEPFFTTKPAGKGTGLGLSLVRDIVGMHGGSVSLVSEVGRGTTVTLHIPSIKPATA